LGDVAVVLDGVGNEYDCQVSNLTRKSMGLAIRRKSSKPRPRCEITLVQAVPKGKIFDSIVQKATELGTSRVVPLLTERVVRQFNDETSDSKVEHWRAIAVESIKQCGSLWLPHIEAPISVADFLGRHDKFDLSLIASLDTDTRHPSEWFRQFRERTRKTNPESVGIWVGPEGDFTPDEQLAVRSAGALPVTLGPLVLRSETAAVYCLSVVNYELSA
jgi:16S rRNA (uracil1498-N3)-methyltransferase